MAAPRRVASVGDLGVVLVAIAAVVGAAWAGPVPVVVVPLAATAPLVRPLRKVWLLAPLAFLAVAALGHRAEAGLAPPAPGPIAGWATLVGDPERLGSSVRADVRIDGRRYEAWFRSGAAGVADEATVGEALWIDGTVTPPDGGDAAWFRPRHVVGRVAVRSVGDHRPAGSPWREAQWIRDVLDRGLTHLQRRDAVLVRGVLVGDDRGQLPEVVDDFRAAGLTHLLAVSGQNVAFVLAVVSPLVARTGPLRRLALVLVVLALFGFVTRWEPSVLRAGAMAGLAAVAVTVGRPTQGIRLLALAVVGLVAIDPLLVWSIGFRLSVAASGGIVLLGPPLARWVRGPTPLRAAVSVTLAAQMAVAPLLVTTFGSVPIVALPANLAAGWVAGLVMMWGLPAGLAAGLSGAPVAEVAHLPTEWGVRWLASVARWSAGLGWPELDGSGVLAIGLVVVASVAVVRRVSPATVVVATAVVALWSAPTAVADGHTPVGAQADLHRHGATVLVIDRPDPAGLLGRLRRLGVDEVDVLVVRSSSGPAGEAARAVAARVDVGTVLAPTGHRVPASVGAEVVDRTTRWTVDSGAAILVEPVDGRLVVDVEPSPVDGRLPADDGR